MDGARSYTATGVVLRHHALKENDRIVALFTREHGLVRAVAKGVRKATSALGGRLEPLRENTLLLARGRQLDIVAQAEGLRRFPHATDDLDRLAAALGGAEVLLAFLAEEDPQPEAYDLFLAFLGELGPRHHPELLLSAFELQLADVLGYRPELEACVACEAPFAEDGHDVWALHIEAGGAVCARCAGRVPGQARRMSPAGWQLLRDLIDTPLPELATRTEDPARLAGMRRALRAYMAFRAEKDLVAQTLFDWAAT